MLTDACNKQHKLTQMMTNPIQNREVEALLKRTKKELPLVVHALIRSSGNIEIAGTPTFTVFVSFAFLFFVLFFYFLSFLYFCAQND
jgi:hypothetical protein